MPDFNILESIAAKSIAQTPNPLLDPSKVAPVTLGEMGGRQGMDRYPNYFRGLDNEDIYGRSQTTTDQWKNGFTKFLVTTGTTFIEGTLGLVNGVYQGISDGKFSSFYDNELNRGLDRFKANLENTLPNYYTNLEKNAKWYSPDTWATANFGADLILKNAGFAVGAYLSGGAWSKGFGSLLKYAAGGEILGAGGKIAQAAQRTEQSILLGREAKVLAAYEKSALEAVATKYNTINKALTIGSNAARAGIATASEAGVEARHAKQEYLDNLIQTYTDKNGFEPSDEEKFAMGRVADSVGNTTWTANAALLSITNYIQLPKIAGKFWKGERATLSGAERGIGRMGIANAQGEILERSANRALREGEKYVSLKATTRIGAQLGRTKVGSFLNRASPYSRILLSPSEGFEEGMQEVISRGTTDYFTDKYNGDNTDFYKSFKEGIRQTLTSKDGQLAIMAGLITGGLMENIASPAMGGRFLGSVKKRNQILQTTETFVNQLNTNSLGSYLKELDKSVGRSTAIQQASEEAVQNGDRLAFEDADTDAALNYLLPRVQYGRTDLVQADIDAQRSLASTEEKFLEMKTAQVVPQDMERSEYLKNLDKLESRLKTVDAQFEALNLRYGTLTNTDGSRTYSMPHLLRMAYTASKIDDYNQRIPTLYTNFNKSGIAIDDVAQQSLLAEQDEAGMNQALTELTQEINAKATSPEMVADMMTQASDIIEMAYLRNQQVLEYERLRDQPQVTPDNSMEFDRETDPLDQIPRPEGISEELDDQLRTIAERQAEGETLTEEEEAIIAANQEIFDTYAQTLSSNRPNPKQAFQQENQDKDFFMEQNGELVQGKLQYDQATNQLTLNGMEITNQDLIDGVVSSDEAVLDSMDYLNATDSRTETSQTKRTLAILQGRLDNATNRQIEVQNKIASHQKDLEEVNRLIEEAEGKQQRQKGIRPNSITNIVVQTLQRLSETRTTLNTELEQLNIENRDLEEMVDEYTTLMETATGPLSNTIDLLQRSVDQANDLVLSNGIIANRLTETLTSLNKSIQRIKTILLDRLTTYVNFTPMDFVAGQALKTLSESPESSIPENLFSIIKTLTGLNIRPVQVREQQTRKELGDTLNKLSNLEQFIRDKQSILDELSSIQPFILNRITIIENATPEVIEQFEDLEETTPQANEVIPEPAVQEESAKQDKFKDTEKKPVSTVYQSNAMPSPATRKTDKNYLKWAYFLSKFRLLQDKDSYKTIFVTKSNEEAVFGQEGYIDQLYTDDNGNPYYQGDEALTGNDPAVALVIVKEVLNPDTGLTELFHINKIGKTTTKVGNKSSLTKAVGWKMPSTLKTYRDSQQDRAYDDINNPDKTLDQQLEEKSAEWEAQRQQILKDTSIPNPHSFTVSQGSLNRGENNNRLRNDVVNTLVSPEDIGRIRILYKVTKEGQVINGSTYKKGSIVVVGSDFHERAWTRALDQKEQDNIFNLLLYMAKNRPSGVEALEPIRNYFQGLFYTGVIGSPANFNFGEDFSFFKIRENEEHEMTEQYLQDNKETILSQLSTINTNVNATLLDQKNTPFQEVTSFDDKGRPVFTSWNSYQEFLLAITDSEGNSRNASLKVDVANQEDSNPTFKDKYVIVGNMSTPRRDKATTPTEKATELVKESGLFTEPTTTTVTPNPSKPKKTTTKVVVKPKTKKAPQTGTYGGRVFNIETQKYETLKNTIDYSVLDQVRKAAISNLFEKDGRTQVRGEFRDETGSIMDADITVVQDTKTGKLYSIPQVNLSPSRNVAAKTKTGTTSKTKTSVLATEEEVATSDDVMDEVADIPVEVIVTPAQIAHKIKPRAKTKTPNQQEATPPNNQKAEIEINAKVKTPTVEETQPLPETTADTQPQTTPQEVVVNVVENATEPTVNIPTLTESTPAKADFKVGQRATVEGNTYEITSIPKYTGFWVSRIDLATNEIIPNSEVFVSPKINKRDRSPGAFYKAFLAEQGIIESTTGPTIRTKC